ncbi:MAG: site-2 protease family protein [Candidatus Pacearchaeota archaeon]|jgi:membrane-associated protease RseP (regulator of RpoE activity)
MKNKEKNQPAPKNLMLRYSIIFLLINLFFSFLLNLIFVAFKLKLTNIYTIISFILAVAISSFYLYSNKDKIKKKEADLFVYWLIILLSYVGAGCLYVGIIILINQVKIVYAYDLIMFGSFCVFVSYFLYKNRKNLKKDGVMYLYRTQVGIKIIDYIGTKYKKTLRVISFLAVTTGYLLMIAMIYFTYKLVEVYLFRQDVVQAIKVPPIMPLMPYVPELFKVNFLPPFYATYWIVSIAVIAIFHEFAHGIIARRYDVKIKTTGFGFLGPFLAAFVEPDEKSMMKKTKFQQISILAAGTFTNLILAIIFLIMLFGFFNLAYTPSGAIFEGYYPARVNISELNYIAGYDVSGLSKQEMIKLIEEKNITDNILFGQSGNEFKLIEIKDSNKNKYFINTLELKSQLARKYNFTDLIKSDMPAIQAGLKGTIISIDDKKVSKHSDLVIIMQNYNPGDEIVIKTKYAEKEFNYKIILTENPVLEGKAFIGIVNSAPSDGFLRKLFNFFREPGTYYDPIRFKDLTIFIYDLIWWLALINLSVALMNMLPVALFDGGRMFMLTVWAITGNQKIAEKVFKFMTYLLLFCLLLLMIGYIRAMF